MAKVQRIIGDQNSAELDEMRYAYHRLLLILRNIGAEISAPSSIGADEAWIRLKEIIDDGIDADTANINGSGSAYVGTGLAITGVEPTPKHPRRPNAAAVAKVSDMDVKELE